MTMKQLRLSVSGKLGVSAGALKSRRAEMEGICFKMLDEAPDGTAGADTDAAGAQDSAAALDSVGSTSADLIKERKRSLTRAGIQTAAVQDVRHTLSDMSGDTTLNGLTMPRKNTRPA